MMSKVGAREGASSMGTPVGGREGTLTWTNRPPAICPRHNLEMQRGRDGCIECRKAKRKKR